MSFNFIQALSSYSLAGAGATIGDTSITLKSFADINGVNYAMADFGAVGYLTMEPGNGSLEEQVSFSGLTQNANGTCTLSGVKTVLFKTPYTETSGLAKTHAGSTSVVVSNTAGFYNQLVTKADAETITGIKTFATGATPIITDAPTTSTQAANKGYVDGVAIAGAPDSSTTVKGIVKMSTAPVLATSPIAVGDNDTRVPTQGENDALVGNNTDIAVGSGNKFITQTGSIHNAEKYAADSGVADAMVVTLSPVPTSLTAGMIVYVKAKYANATTTPTINVNGLGAKTIVKAVSTALLAGDIQANQFITLVYDGANFILQNPAYKVNSGIYATGNTTAPNPGSPFSNQTQTIAHGLGVIPKKIRFSFYYGGTWGCDSTYVNNAPSTIYRICNQSNVSIVDSGVSTSFVMYLRITNTSEFSQAVVASVDATNITLTWSYDGTWGTSGAFPFKWEAEA